MRIDGGEGVRERDSGGESLMDLISGAAGVESTPREGGGKGKVEEGDVDVEGGKKTQKRVDKGWGS
jgi:hypothetical protein